MSKVVVGDILSLKIKYPDNEIAEKNHYYLVIEEIQGQKYVMLEITQLIFDDNKISLLREEIEELNR